MTTIKNTNTTSYEYINVAFVPALIELSSLVATKADFDMWDLAGFLNKWEPIIGDGAYIVNKLVQSASDKYQNWQFSFREIDWKPSNFAWCYYTWRFNGDKEKCTCVELSLSEVIAHERGEA